MSGRPAVLRRPPGWRTIALVGTVPVLVGLARFLTSVAVLDGDEAVFAAQVADAATGGFPTVGLYSRFGWNHPGPAAFYLFAPFHWISGGAPWGAVLGAAVWNAAAVVLAAWLASRRGGSALVLGAVAITSATWLAIGDAAPLDPWTPNLAAVLVPLLLFAAWGAAVGDAVAWAVLLVGASVAVQVHVGYGVVLAVPIAAAVATCLTRERRLGDPSLLRNRALRTGVGLSVVVWSPVVIDAATGTTGNIGALWRYFRRDDQPSVGLADGARIVAREVAPWPSWLTGPRPSGLFSEASPAGWGWLLVPVVSLAAAAIVVRRRRDPAGERLVIVAAAAGVAALLAAGQVRGIRFDYLFFWRTPIVLFVALAVAAAFVHRAPSVLRRPVAALVLVAAVTAATISVASADEVTRHGRDVAALVDEIEERPTGPVLVRLADSGFVGAGPGVLGWLEAEGTRAGVDPAVGWVFGDRTMTIDEAAEVWYVADTGWGLSLVSALPGARVVAGRTPLDDADEARVRELHRSIAAQLDAAGFVDDVVSLDSPLVELALGGVPGIDTDALAELAAWNEQVGEPGRRFGIVAFDPALAPELPWRLAGF